MAFFEFPHTRTYDSDLGWLIKAMKNVQKDIDQLDTTISEKVDDWLNEHPEATTTVQDGSLTEAKFSNVLKLQAIKDYVTPEMYGAVGDGVADDTNALNDMFSDGFGTYLFKNEYAITSSVNASGTIFGHGKVLAKDSARINNGFFNVSGNISIEGITFDCACSQEFTSDDVRSWYNVGVWAASNGYDVVINNVTFINNYTTFVWCSSFYGKLSIKNSTFRAEGTNNKYTGVMIHLLTVYGTDNIDIIGNKFYGNGTPTSNFGGIYMAGIATRSRINIGQNFFNGLGRTKTGGAQMHVIDAYWNVSHLNIYNNVMINNSYGCLRIHGGEDYDIHDNYFGNSTFANSDPCMVVSDAPSSTGLAPIGVSNIKFRNNVFETVEKFQQAIDLISVGSPASSSISDVVIKGNVFKGNYYYALRADGTVKSMDICENVFNSSGGIHFDCDLYAFSSTSPISIRSNRFALTAYAVTNKGTPGSINLQVVGNYFVTNGFYAIYLRGEAPYTYALHNTIIGTHGIYQAYTVGGNILNITNANLGILSANSNFNNYINGALSA